MAPHQENRRWSVSISPAGAFNASLLYAATGRWSLDDAASTFGVAGLATFPFARLHRSVLRQTQDRGNSTAVPRPGSEVGPVAGQAREGLLAIAATSPSASEAYQHIPAARLRELAAFAAAIAVRDVYSPLCIDSVTACRKSCFTHSQQERGTRGARVAAAWRFARPTDRGWSMRCRP